VVRARWSRWELTGLLKLKISVKYERDQRLVFFESSDVACMGQKDQSSPNFNGLMVFIL